MKTILLFIVSIYLQVLNLATAQVEPFSQVYYAVNETGIQTRAITATYDNGYIIVGSCYYLDGLIYKIDSVGNVIWSKSFVEYNNYYLPIKNNTIIETADSAYVIAGQILRSYHFFDAHYLKINNKGDTLWTKSFSVPNFNSNIISIQQTNDLGFILIGNLSDENNMGGYPYSFINSKILILKTDSIGNIQWSKQLFTTNEKNIGLSIKQTLDSGFIMTGYISNGIYPILIKLNKNAEIEWQKKYFIDNQPYAFFGDDIIILKDGYLVHTNNGLFKTNLNGEIEWRKKFQYEYYTDYDIHPKMYKTYDGNYVIENPSGIYKTDTTGNMIWSKEATYASNINLTLSKDSGFVIVVNNPPNSVSATQIGIIKTNSLGIGKEGCIYNDPYGKTYPEKINADTANFTTILASVTMQSIPLIIDSINLNFFIGCIDIGVDLNNIETTNSFSLYPNPSNGYMQVSYNMSSTKNTTLEIYDITGKMLYSLPLNSAAKYATINCSNLLNGVYYYHVLLDNKIYKRDKIILIK